MKRSIWVALVAAAVLSACKEKPAEAPPPPKEEAPPAAVAPPEVKKEEAPPPAAEAAADDELKATPEMVEKYAKYVVEAGPIQSKRMKAIKEATGKDDGVAKMTLENELMTKELNQARDKAGLTEEELQAVSQLVSDVTTSRKIWKMGGGDNNQMMAEAKKNLEKATPEQRAAAEKQIKEMEEGFAKMRDVPEARAKYGAPAVDAVIKHEDAFSAYQAALLKAL